MTSAGVPDADRPICSAKGCRRPAGHFLYWRNPRIHDQDRRKTWSACDDHVDPLAGFLRARDFPLEVAPVPVGADDAAH